MDGDDYLSAIGEAMSDRRTDAQIFADDFDCELYRLIGRAQEQGMTDKRWHKVAEALLEARPLVRSQMSAEDRERTS
jgi:hypothetical protein